MEKSLLLGAVLASIATPAALAQPLEPIHNASIDLGSTRGSAYYVVAQDGYHLVATLRSGFASTPVRFTAILADGQSASVSVPGPVGTNPTEVVFSRTANHLDVRQSTDLTELATQ